MADDAVDENEEEDMEFLAKQARNPHLFAAVPPPPKRMFCYDWTQGYVSPFVAAGTSTAQQLLRMVKASTADCVYDLGCGDGQILIAAAKEFGSKGLGVDLDEELVAQARASAQAEGVADRVEFRCEDLRDLDLGGATIVVIFLLPAAIALIEDRLVAYLKERPDAVVVSIQWEVGACKEWEVTRSPGDQALEAKPFFMYGRSANRVLEHGRSVLDA